MSHVHRKRQVQALRPNARGREDAGCGWLIFDGDECLDDGGNDPFSHEWQAWELAFRHLMRNFREQEQPHG